MKAVAVRDGSYEGKRIRKGESFDFDEKKYKSKSKDPWFQPAERVRVIQPTKEAPKTLKESGARGGKSFIDAMKDKVGFESAGIRVVPVDDLAK